MAEKTWAARLPAVKSKADLVYESLRGAIADGHLRPGERINMDEMARNLGVSKIPVREAVKRLESEGLLTSRVHSGVVVAQVDKTEMRGVFLAREAIDGLVARLAAEHSDDGLLRNLEAVQDGMRDALRTTDTDELQRLNSEFHRLLAEASGYRILTELTEQLLLTIRRYRVTAPQDARNWSAVIDEHDAIMDALRRKDAGAAAAAAQAHTLSQAGHEVSAHP
ncbi:GntR family transcriptional regulator [Streptomyces sp. L2]|uniref:GntR family transcriptional regulator n=1 Tax=Streptomyces sp. L2 TaxID=2162665 RepID=UPI0013E91116|nr:GntR family transcriptional regulator [Streptomyces sp. L2]